MTDDVAVYMFKRWLAMLIRTRERFAKLTGRDEQDDLRWAFLDATYKVGVANGFIALPRQRNCRQRDRRGEVVPITREP